MHSFKKCLETLQTSLPHITDILVDMDGVLVDDVAMFSSLVPNITDMESYLKFLTIQGKRQDFIFPLIEKAIIENAFEEAPPTNFLKVLREVLIPFWKKQGIKVSILTSTMAVNPNRSLLENQKLNWLKANGLEQVPVIFSKGSAKKQEHATPTTLLIDDFDRTISQFRKSGGMAIQYTKLTDVLEQLELLGLYEVFTDF